MFADEFNFNLKLELIKKVNLKTINRVALEKCRFLQVIGKYSTLRIPSIRDRILQQFFELAFYPFLSIKRTQIRSVLGSIVMPHQVISIIADSAMRYFKINQLIKRFSPRKVSREAYNKSLSRKFKIKRGNIGGLRKSKQMYNKYYYVFPFKTLKKRMTRPYNPYIKYLNVDIVGCFGTIAHCSILKFTPIADKYLFLLKALPKALIVGVLK